VVAIRHERLSDVPAREALLDHSFGEDRFAKTCERLRVGRMPAAGLALIATDDGRVVGTVRLWHVSTGFDRPALLLGPLAVDPDCRSRGIGAALMNRAIAEARRRGHRIILLVGDAPYYAKFGFSAAATGNLSLPGPYEPHRLLGLALQGESLAAELGEGLVRATGRAAPRVADGTASPVRRRKAGLSHAA
jgi:predicted N-acetyltransferase YhbS